MTRPCPLRRLLCSLLLAFALGLLGLGSPPTVFAQEELRLVSSSVVSEFPQGVRFSVEVSGPEEVQEVTLRFRVLGERAQRYDNFQFQAASRVQAELLVRTDTADRYIPPGAELEYRFEVRDATGRSLVTEPQRFILLDPRFEWRVIQAAQVSIRYHGAARDRAQRVLDGAQATIADIGALMGVEVQEPLRLTMYNSLGGMRDALPPRSQVQEGALITQGVHFPGTGVILILGEVSGVNGVTSHEVVHFLMDQAMGSLTRIVPAWFSEGLAEYGSREPNPTYDFALRRAVQSDALIPLTSLNTPPGPPSDVILMYGEGKSAVAYMVEVYGAQPLRDLLRGMRQGLAIDGALEAAYGFDRVGLERLWRAHIGAAPLPAGPVRSVPTAIPYPTIIPFGVEAPTPFPTSPPPPSPPAQTPESSGACGRGSDGDTAIPLIALGMVAALVWRRCR